MNNAICKQFLKLQHTYFKRKLVWILTRLPRNDTLADTKHNRELNDGMVDGCSALFDSSRSATASMLNIFQAMFVVKKHVIQVIDVLSLLRRKADLLLDNVRHAQSRNVQPQTASAELLLDSAFPTYTILPFLPSTDSKNSLYEVCDVQVQGLKADKLYGKIQC